MTSPHSILVYPGAFNGIQGTRHDSSGTVCNLTPLMLAMEAQDPYTQGHGRRVAAYAERMARRIGLAGAEIETIRLGGLLHDIGKIAFSTKLLNNRNSRLSGGMRAEIRQHPVIGGDFLKAINVAEPVIDCVRFHHERLDGSGYPHALRAHQIPRAAAIVAVADCFDALTTNRPYQKRRSQAQALSVMEHLAGAAFEAGLIHALVEDVRENGLRAA
jgi:putative nucleotidyltransferase with HDIG domain